MASDDFNGSDGTALDTHSADWAAASPSSTVDFDLDGSSNAVVKHANRWTNPNGTMNDGAGTDPDISELAGIDLTSGAGAKFIRPACRMSASSRGYSVSPSDNGTVITALALNRHTTSSISSVTGLTVGDATNCDIAVTAEDEGGDVRVKVYVDQVEELSYLDTNAAKITSGSGSGWLAYAAGQAQGVGTEVPLWRDTVGAPPGGGGIEIFRRRIEGY